MSNPTEHVVDGARITSARVIARSGSALHATARSSRPTIAGGDDAFRSLAVFAELHDVNDPDSLQAVPAFQAFVADIADRCDIPPVAMGATIVGGYR